MKCKVDRFEVLKHNGSGRDRGQAVPRASFERGE